MVRRSRHPFRSLTTRAGALAAVAIAVTASGTLLGIAPAHADSDVDDFTFDSYDADYYLERADDGSSRLRTVETIVAEFPDADQNRGIVRLIPLDFEGADLQVAVESVTDADGTAVPYTESVDDGFREVSIGTDEFVRGEQTYVVTYGQRNVIRAYDDTDADEFYWDLNGTGWNQPFGSVTGRVHVPDDIAAELTGSGSCYQGGFGAMDSCLLEEGPDEGGGTVFTASADGIEPEQTVTVAIGFDRGTFAEPERARDQPWVVALPAVIASLGALLAAGAALLRFTRWKDAPRRGVIVAQYERPDAVDVLEAGELVGRGKNAMSAELIDLAVRGNLRIVDLSPTDADTPAFSLEFVSFDGLAEPERKVMRAVFGRDPEPGLRKVVATSVSTGRSLHTQAVDARRRVIEKGWKRAVSRVSTGAIAIAAGILGIIGVVVFVVLVAVNALTLPGALLIVAVIALAVGAIVVASKRSALTAAGADVRDHLDGLREYIRLAEADRMRMLQSPEGAERRRVGPSDPAQVVRVYERLLPFAVLFDLEKQWSEELERLYRSTDDSPGWYLGNRPFDSTTFAGFMVASNAQATASTWSGSGAGSSFGGSTGGGFAGGGGGGGGGGGR